MTEDPDDFQPPDYSYEIQMRELDRKSWIELNSPIMSNDLLARRIHRPPWLFEDFLLSHTLTMVSGEPFAGKSLCLMAMLAAINSGEPLFGAYPVAGGQRAMFIGQDSPTWDYYGQYQKLARALQLPPDRFQDAILLINKGLDLLDPATMKIIEEGIEFFNISVLMLDTLLELHSTDENSNTLMKPVMARLKYLRDRHSLSVFFTTHLGKSAEGKSANYRARGATVIAGSADQHIMVSRLAEGGFRVKTPKARGGDKLAEAISIKFSASLLAGEPILALSQAEDPYRKRQEILLQIFADGKPHGRKEVISILSASYPEWSTEELGRRASNSLKYLAVKGLLRKTEWGIYVRAENPESLPPKGASE
jgi:hypothetical protein